MSERFTITVVYMRGEHASVTLTWPDCNDLQANMHISEAHARFKLNRDFTGYILTVVQV